MFQLLLFVVRRPGKKRLKFFFRARGKKGRAIMTMALEFDGEIFHSTLVLLFFFPIIIRAVPVGRATQWKGPRRKQHKHGFFCRSPSMPDNVFGRAIKRQFVSLGVRCRFFTIASPPPPRAEFPMEDKK